MDQAEGMRDPNDHAVKFPAYVLVTPSRNEEKLIGKTIESVAQQTVLPLKWVIVNDGSTDSTGTIAERYAAQYAWIEVVNRPVRKERNFAAKVHAFNAGRERLGELNYADVLPSIMRNAVKHRMRLPNEFVLVTKQMLYFDRYAKVLAPRLNIFSDPRLVASIGQDVMRARLATA